MTSVLPLAMKMGLPRVYRRDGEALVLSITLVPGKAYTAAVTQCKTKDVAEAAAEGASLMAIQTNDPPHYARSWWVSAVCRWKNRGRYWCRRRE